VIQRESEAKDFFVSAILSQAAREGVALSDDERWMLRFSESDPGFVVDPARMQQLEAEMSDQAYEAKVTGLIRRAYEHDRRQNSDADATYHEARGVLGRGDHYLLVMIDQALGAVPQRGSMSVVVRVGLLLVLVPAVILTVVIVIGLAGILATGQSRSAREALPYAGGVVLFAGMSWYLIRLIVREGRARLKS
jgi:hypothetical protein